MSQSLKIVVVLVLLAKLCSCENDAANCTANAHNLLAIVPSTQSVFLVTRDWLISEIDYKDLSYGELHVAHHTFHSVENKWPGLAQNEPFHQWRKNGGACKRNCLVKIYPINGWVYLEPDSGHSLRYNPESDEVSIDAFFLTNGLRYFRVHFSLIDTVNQRLCYNVEYDVNRDAIGRLVLWHFTFNGNHALEKAKTSDVRYYMYKWEDKMVLTREYVRDDNVLGPGQYLQAFTNWTTAPLGFIYKGHVHLVDVQAELVYIFGIDEEASTSPAQLFRLITHLETIKFDDFFQCDRDKPAKKSSFPPVVNEASKHDKPIDPSRPSEDIDGYKVISTSDPLGMQTIVIVLILVLVWIIFSSVVGYFFYTKLCQSALEMRMHSVSLASMHRSASSPQTLAGLNFKRQESQLGLIGRLIRSVQAPSDNKLNALKANFIKSRDPAKMEKTRRSSSFRSQSSKQNTDASKLPSQSESVKYKSAKNGNDQLAMDTVRNRRSRL